MVSMSRRNVLGLLGSSSLLLVGRSAYGSVESLSTRGAALDAQGIYKHRGQISTRLTREYDLTHPFVGAGMAFVSGPELVSAVSNAGGMGTLGTGPMPPAALEQLIRATRSMTSAPFAVDMINATSAMGSFATNEHVEVLADQRVPVVVFFWNTPQRSWVERLQRAGTRVWMQVGSVREAVEAYQVGVDAIICQGTGAGGHNKSTAPTMQLLRQVRAVLGRGVMLLAAGGITEGRDVAQVLEAGAEGVWVGTRLVASTEAYAHAEYKRRITRATPHSTAHTTLFGPEWEGAPMRVLRNRVVNQWAGREDEAPKHGEGSVPLEPIGTTRLGGDMYTMPKYSAIIPTPDTQGDFEEMCLPAGIGASRIRRIQPAAEIVSNMMDEAADFLR
jgi:enoyl-[acyl-carrier protein] reductase II